MADSARDKVTRTLADYLPYSQPSENIEDRREDDPRTVALNILAHRHPIDRASRKYEDMMEAERIGRMFRPSAKAQDRK
jgi:hypothetical protein